MIRKLEHDREKLSGQLELSQESASQAKKVARESEGIVKSEREKSSKLEQELQRLLEHRELLEETGDLAHQESAKIKHMLLLAESQLGMSQFFCFISLELNFVYKKKTRSI